MSRRAPVVVIEQHGAATVWCTCGWRANRITPGPGWADAPPRSAAWIAAGAQHVAEQHLRRAHIVRVNS